MADAPILAGIKKERGEQASLALLILIVSDFVKFFTVGRGMNNDQVIETAKLFFTEFYFLKLSDLKLFFARMKTGYYGTVFDRMDGNVIFINLRTYCNERMEVAENLSLEKHKELKALDGEDRYIISLTAETFIQDLNGKNEFAVTDARDKATRYTFSEAIEIKRFLIKNFELEPGEEIRIERPLKPVQSLLDYIKNNKPSLLPEDIKRKDRLNELKAQAAVINSDDSLSPYKKRCKLNELYGFTPITEAEFEAEQKAIQNK